MKNLFVFPNAVNRYSPDERIKLNIQGTELHFYHDQQEVIIDTDNLRDGSSTMILSNFITKNTYSLYNFRELLEVLDMAPSEFLSNMNQRGFMQIDKCGGKIFVKVFLLAGDNELQSDTDDFSNCAHCTKDYIHPLDWRYSWTLQSIAGGVINGLLRLELELAVSEFWQRDIYVSHGGQYAKLDQGLNVVEFKYIPTENAYLGNPNCRYKGRAIDLSRLLNYQN